MVALKSILARGFKRIIVEADCQVLIRKLHRKEHPTNLLGCFISGILSLSELFKFISWSLARRGGNAVVLAIAHFQPIVFWERVPDHFNALTSKDVYCY